jgi:azurin
MIRIRPSYLLAATALTLGLSIPAQAAPRVVNILGTDDMRYSVTKIEAKAGEEIKVVLETKSAMPKDSMAHNFILLDPSVNVDAFVAAASVARNSGYVPKKFADKILAQTALAGGGEKVEVTFKAPAKPGTYLFICTFPGHYAGGMKGELIVK